MALDPNLSYWISMIVFDELQKCCDMMNLQGEDRKVYEFCMADFRDYVSYIEENFPKSGDAEPLFAEDENFAIVRMLFGSQGIMMANLEGTKEIIEFVHVWVQWWWRKYQERTKIVFNELPQKFNSNIVVDFSQFTTDERYDIVRATINALIKYGEICCPSILADALFKKTIQASQRKEWRIEDKVNLIAVLQRDARQMAYTHGTLLFIKPDKTYGIREWRNYGQGNKII